MTCFAVYKYVYIFTVYAFKGCMKEELEKEMRPYLEKKKKKKEKIDLETFWRERLSQHFDSRIT